MGLKTMISNLLSFTRVTRNAGTKVSDVKADTGGGNVLTAQNFSPPGEDSHPVPNVDYALFAPSTRSGVTNCIGYVDPLNEPVAQVGEKRVYARTSDGAITCEFHLKNDGEISAFNAAGYFKLRPDGTFEVNNVTIDPAGNIVTPTSVTAEDGIYNDSLIIAGKELRDHLHGGVDTGPSNTGPNI